MIYGDTAQCLHPYPRNNPSLDWDWTRVTCITALHTNHYTTRLALLCIFNFQMRYAYTFTIVISGLLRAFFNAALLPLWATWTIDNECSPPPPKKKNASQKQSGQILQFFGTYSQFLPLQTVKIHNHNILVLPPDAKIEVYFPVRKKDAVGDLE